MATIHGWAGASAQRQSASGARTGRDALAWAKGAGGELVVGRMLDSLIGVRVLHDRAVPGSTANIDHIAIAPSGVYVIDAKHYAGTPRLERLGDGSVLRLRVGRADRTELVASARKQLGIVAEALGAGRASGAARTPGASDGSGRSGVNDPPVPVHAVLCFVSADWAGPGAFVIDGVGVTSPEGLAAVLGTAGSLTSTRVASIHAMLRERLAAAWDG